MKLTFSDEAWEDYQWFLTNDRRTLRRINTLIEDIKRNGYEGIGKPEPLRHNLSGLWSRRITGEHRIVYKIDDDTAVIFACRYHYGE
ncbi:Txe/YoeB family addiction module toxin [Nocardia sp. CA-135953]|uniref:Txe/YoeB family addiction module toxin n=1 Tax=Nocardia sp. CA-135953 TaxID=3239978 RepID=UPI003D96285D